MNLIKQLDRTRVLMLAILVLGGVIAQVSGCNREQPVERTEAYYTLHGLVPGQVNELQIGEYKFRFPAKNFPEPFTDAKRASDIVKGKAERATVQLDLSSWFERPLVNPLQQGAVVKVEFWPHLNSGERIKTAQEAELKNGPWKSIENLAQIGLRRYARATGGWGELTYVPIDPAIKTPDGALMLYNCSAVYKSIADGKLPEATDQPEVCRVAFRHPGGPYIWYYLSGALMPRWQEVHQEVLNFVDTTLIKN